MKNIWLRWILAALLVSVFFFGCERKPGEKLYSKAMAEWSKVNLARARALLDRFALESLLIPGETER